jgi:hypothetical protein
MKIKELIEILKKHDENLDVKAHEYTRKGLHYFHDIHEEFIERSLIDRTYPRHNTLVIYRYEAD